MDNTKCKYCGKEIPAESEFCPFCGKTIEKKNVCPKCGKELAGEFTFCPYCGSSLTSFDTGNNSSIDKDVSLLLDEASVLFKGSSSSKQSNEFHDKKKRHSSENSNRSNRKVTTIIAILLAVSLIGNAVLGYYTYHYYDLTWYWYNEEVKVEQHLDEANAKVTQYKSVYDFFMQHACIVSKGSDYYHVYGCNKCDTSSFLIFNTENAEYQGYSPCPYCH